MRFSVIADDKKRQHWRDWARRVLGPEVSLDADDLSDICLVAVRDPEISSTISTRLSQGQTIWVVPDANLGAEFVYALIPRDEEFPGRLWAIWPLRAPPAVQHLKQLLRGGSLGTVLHLQMERSEVGGPSFPPDAAHAAWLEDADLLRSLVDGEYRRVTAIHSGVSSQGITTASVSLSGDGVPDAMWAFRASGNARTELTITTDRGASVLAWNNDAPPTLTINCQAIATSDSPESASPAPPLSIELPPPAAVTPWSDAVRAFDLLDAARRSITRRRTVELQFESTSERSQFKTQMTAVGCMLLLLTMFGLIGLLFAGRMLDPRDSQQKQSEVAGFILTDDHFDGATLNAQGRETMNEIVENYGRRSATILLEGEPTNPELVTRRESVVQELEAAQLTGAEIRTLVRPLQGIWFKRGMVIAWVVLFLPLGVLIALQLLIGFTPNAGGGNRNNPQSRA